MAAFAAGASLVQQASVPHDDMPVLVANGLRCAGLGPAQIGGAMRTFRLVVYVAICLAVAAASVSATLAAVN